MNIKDHRMKSLLFVLGSFGLTSIVIGNAFYQKKQFYPSMVYLTKSNSSLAVIYMQVFVLALSLVKVAKTIFFGQLRPGEVEHIMEKGWFALTETCLAFTLFRDEFTSKFVALFAFLLVVKCFHWLGEERVDNMERSPVITLLFKLRITTLIMLLTLLDTYFVHAAYLTTVAKGANVQMVFGFEYAILFILVLNINIKFVLHLVDLYGRTPWENKATYLLYLELFTGFFRVTLYVTFLGIMMRIHTFPLFAIRPMYLAFKTLKRATRDIIASRRAIHNMNTLYPNPDPLTDFPSPPDNTTSTSGSAPSVHHAPLCIICREEMRASGFASCKKLPCSHIFHTACLRGWFQRQQTCPTCRLDILKPGVAPTPAATRPVHLTPQGSVPLPPANMAHPPLHPPFPFLFPPPPMFPPFPPFAPYGQAMPPPHPPSSSTGAANQQLFEPWSKVPPRGMPSFGGPPSAASGGSWPPPFPRMPDPQFSTLSDAELRAMEGRERSHVEARITCLRNVQLLLDSAVVQLAQYASLPPPSRDPISPADTSAFSDAPSSSTSARPESSNNFDKASSSTSVPEFLSPKTGPNDLHSEIRKRRIEKLSKKDTE